MIYIERLKELRIKCGLSQEQVGKAIGKSQQWYNHIENGKNKLKLLDFIRLCEFYNISSDYLLGRIDNPKPLYENCK